MEFRPRSTADGRKAKAPRMCLAAWIVENLPVLLRESGRLLVLAGGLWLEGCSKTTAPATVPVTGPSASESASQSASQSASLANAPASTPSPWQEEAPPELMRIELRLTSEAYQQLEPQRGGLFLGGGNPFAGASPAPVHTAEARARGERPKPAVGFRNFGDDSGAGTFGYEFETVHADVQLGETELREIGLRYKGNGSFQNARQGRKRSFKLEFDRYVPGQRFEGVTRLNLNCNSLDPTQLRDALGYRLFTEAGLPSPQTRFSELFVKIGDAAPERLGLYTVVEQVDRKFLKKHLGSQGGLLLKPEGIKGIPWFGTEIHQYEQPYNAKWRGTDQQWERVIEFARLVNRAEDREFEQAIESILDVDRFLKFLACHTLLANLDSFLGTGHNYYLYLDDDTNRFVFLPWDLDLSFGAFFMAGSVEELADLSLSHPHQGNNRLIDRLLQNRVRREAFLGHVRDIASRAFHPQALGQVAANWEQFIAPVREREEESMHSRGESAEGRFGMWQQSQMLPSRFIELRCESIQSQLTGQQAGFVPNSGWGGMRRNRGRAGFQRGW